VSATNWRTCPKCQTDTDEGNEQFREDYEIYWNDGEFVIYYGGVCSICKFKHNFNHREDIIEPIVRKPNDN